LLNGRLAVTRLQACGFKRQACRFIKVNFPLFLEAFGRIFHALIHLGKEKIKKRLIPFINEKRLFLQIN